MSAAGKLLPTDNVDAMGPYDVTIEMNVGPNMGWIAHPTQMGAHGELHPIFSWGCGGGSQPSQYMDHITRWASHGFMVEAHVSNGDGNEHKMILDWLTAQNEDSSSPYYHKLDVSKIAVGGHSIGSIATFAFEANDKRVTTSIHVAGGSFDGNGYMSLHTPVLMVDADGDTLALSNTEADYAACTVPVFLTVITGSDHIYAARDGLAPIVAWLRWWLGGETERKSMFIGANCDFCMGKYVSMSKNW
jgi:predicted dienelactone hydrolase